MFEIKPDGQVEHIQKGICLETCQSLSIEDAHGHRHIFEVLFTLLGGNDDLLDPGMCALLDLRLGRGHPQNLRQSDEGK